MFKVIGSYSFEMNFLNLLRYLILASTIIVKDIFISFLFKYTHNKVRTCSLTLGEVYIYN